MGFASTELLDHLSTGLSQWGQFEAALAASEVNLRAKQTWQGSADPSSLRAELTRAACLYGAGQYATAERQLSAALSLAREAHEHDLALKLQGNLGTCLYQMGRTEEAVAHLQEVVSSEQRTRGPLHPDTVVSRVNLLTAAVHLPDPDDQQLAAEAHSLLNIADRQAAIRVQSALAVIRGRSGASHAQRVAEAAQIAASQQQLTGPEHPDTLLARRNSSLALARAGQHSEAVRELRQVIAIQERVAAPDHPDTLHSYSNLASILKSRERYAEAAIELQKAVAGAQIAYGPDHPFTVGHSAKLAYALARAGALAEAAEELERCTAAALRMQGLTPQEQLQIRAQLAYVATLLPDQRAAAVAELRAVLSAQEQLPAPADAEETREKLSSPWLAESASAIAQPIGVHVARDDIQVCCAAQALVRDRM